MHTITSLKLKNNRVQVYINAIYSFSCSEDFVLENKIYNGMYLKDNELEELKNRAVKDQLKYKLIEYAYSKPSSEKELFLKLNKYSFKKYKQKVDKGDFDEMLKYIKSKGYYSESNNLERHLEHLRGKNRGDRYIKQKLLEKGFERKEIESLLKIDKKDNSEIIRELILKRLSKLDKNNYKDRAKVYRYCVSQGFSYDEIEKVWKSAINQ